MRAPTATRSARMAAPIRSTARSPSPRERWTRRRGRTSTTPRRSARSARTKQWGEPGKIVSLDPWGHRVAHDFGDLIAEGIDIRPTIAITKARLTLHEIQARDRAGPARGRRRDRPRGGRRLGHQDRDRSGLVAAGRGRALRGEGIGPSPLPVRADRRHVLRSRHPLRSLRLPAPDRRHDALHFRRPRPARQQAQDC